MFGIGPQELILVALVALLIFGPHKASSVSRDVGRFVH
jgi:Sec-independent protein translocase protein TatA